MKTTTNQKTSLNGWVTHALAKSAVVALILCMNLCAQGQGAVSANYDESKVGTYTLPDPLVFSNGKQVRNARDWERRRREILELFEENVYCRSPKPPRETEFTVVEVGNDVCPSSKRLLFTFEMANMKSR